MLLNHHILAKKATDSVLAKFKTGEWSCCETYGKHFYRTGCSADFPSPDAAFADSESKIIVSFEFKPPTETKRGILTGLGQSIAYLQFSDLSYLVIPEVVEDYNIASHVSDIFSKVITDSIPVGLISYKNNDPEEVYLAHNIKHLSKHEVNRHAISNGRFWAKHTDMPIPLFHLILHYAYLKKINNEKEDAFAKCWKEAMAPIAYIKKLDPQPLRDVRNEIIMTPAGNKPQTYFEKRIKAIKVLPQSDQAAEIQKLIEDVNTNTSKDNMYNSIRKNCLPFMRHLGMLDSAYELTSEGFKMYNLGMMDGPQSRIFRDYFTRMVLLDGHHIDLIYDLERLSCKYRGMKNETEILSLMFDEYSSRGMIKTNPGRRVQKENAKPPTHFKYELILWRSLGLMKKAPGEPAFAFDWQRITEVCNLPSL